MSKEVMRETEEMLEMAQASFGAGEYKRGMKLLRQARGKLNAELGQVGQNDD